MTNDSESFKRKQEQRYVVLKHMYDVAIEEKNNPEWTYFDSKSVAEDLPYPEQEIESALAYLKGEHLVETAYATLVNASYKIAHLGVREIERSMQRPEEHTEHFPPQIIQNFISGSISAFQTGPHATANVTQNVGADLSDVFSLLAQLKLRVSELPQEQQEDASVSIEALEDELKLQDKNPKRIRAAFAGLRGIKDAVIFSSQVTTLAQQLKDLNVF